MYKAPKPSQSGSQPLPSGLFVLWDCYADMRVLRPDTTVYSESISPCGGRVLLADKSWSPKTIKAPPMENLCCEIPIPTDVCFSARKIYEMENQMKFGTKIEVGEREKEGRRDAFAQHVTKNYGHGIVCAATFAVSEQTARDLENGMQFDLVPKKTPNSINWDEVHDDYTLMKVVAGTTYLWSPTVGRADVLASTFKSFKRGTADFGVPRPSK